MLNLSNDFPCRRLGAVWALLLIAGIAGDASGQPGDQSLHRHVADAQPVSETILIRATDGIAVIRAAKDPMATVRVGDLIGLSKAVVKEISEGRLVLEEKFTGKDGKPNRALIVIKEGERGGTRYLHRAGEAPFAPTAPLIAMPSAPDSARPSVKKPPQM